MLCRAMVFVLAVSFAATAACAAERAAAPAVQPEPDGSLASGWAMSGDTAPGVAVGDPAPAFSYLGIDGDWHRSHDLIVGGPVLLVFGAGEAQLVELEQQLGAFHELGVQPVAVLDMRTGSAARLVQRLHYGGGTVVDPQCAIAELYSTLDPITRHHGASCYLIDARGTLRGAVRGRLPNGEDLLGFAAHSLGKPLPETTITSCNFK